MMDSLEALGKLKLERIISCLIYGMDSSGEIGEDYESMIRNSFDEFTVKLEAMYEGVDKEDNRLFEIISDFAEIHDDVYFDVGFFTGVKLLRNLGAVCGKDIDFRQGAFWSGSNPSKCGNSEESILHQFIQVRMGIALEESLRKDVKFQESGKRSREIIKEMGKKFTPEQMETIDAVLSENNGKAAEYGKIAYQQGALDMFRLLKELFLQI